jgi:hypothetical protein
MKVELLDDRFVANWVGEYSVTPQRTAVTSSVHIDLLSANSFGGGGGGGGGSGGGSDSNNGNEGNEGNEGTEGNEGDESDENNEGNEGNEGNFWNDVGSGLSNLGGNIAGGFHQIGGAIGDIGGGEDSGNEGNETNTSVGAPVSSSGIASGRIPSAGQTVSIRTTSGGHCCVSLA